MAELQVLNGPLQWKTFKIAGPRFLMGRKDTCHLVLNDGWVSREHAVVIETSAGEYAVQDLGSENGIFVNGERVTDSKLKHADILRVGRTEMRLFNPTGEESGVGLGDFPRRSTAPDLPEPAAAAHFDMTIQELGGIAKPQPDLRDRGRRLENLLNEKEEDNSRLAAENAILKRALAQGGLIDPATGHVDLQRLSVPVPREGLPRDLVPLIANPASSVTWPLCDGGTFGQPFARDVAVGSHRLGVVGLGRGGVRIADALHALGWRHVAAVAADAEVLATVPWETTLELPAGLDDVRRVGMAVEERRSEIDTLLSAALGVDRTLRLITVGLGGATGIGSIPVVADALHALDADAACGVIVSVPSARSATAEHRIAAAHSGFKTVLMLHDAGKLRPFVLFDESRLQRIVGEQARSAQNATIAGLVDTVVRLPALPSIGGDLDAAVLCGHLETEGMSSFGLAASPSTDADAIGAALRHALGDGWLCSSVPPSRGRAAVVVAMIGDEALAGDSSVANRLGSAINEASELLPQAAVSMGIYEDCGRGVRIVAWVGGLPFPENLAV
jgi:cell division GTPase FtsZ